MVAPLGLLFLLCLTLSSLLVTAAVAPTTSVPGGALAHGRPISKQYDGLVCKSAENKATSTGNCTCLPYGEDDEQQVDCSHLHFTSLPINAHLPSRTSVLNMNQNNISRLVKLEKNDDIKHLNLAANDMTEIDHFAFEQTKNLISLDLSYNHLTKLDETLFDSLETLQSLNLSYNKLEYLPNDIFKKCDRLFELRLAHNPLKQINAQTFFFLQQVEILDLSQNEIFSLESGTFHSMGKLDTLDLSGNDFESVPINALRNTRKLTTLDLSSNPIRTINEASFHKLYSLKELIMNDMKALVEIQKKAFSSLFNLERLTIQHCPHLSYIDPYAFMGAFNHSWMAIRHVSFRRNSLSTLSERTLPFCNLTELDLTENPWHCDCHLHWIKYCEEQKKNFQRGLLCAAPDKLRGHQLETLPHSSLVCDSVNPMQQSSVLFFLSIFFMFLMFGTLVIFLYRDRMAGYYGSNRKQGSIYYVRAQSENE